MFEQWLLVLRFNRDVECTIDPGKDPVCKTKEIPKRRSEDILNKHIPLYDPYIPRGKTLLYNCSGLVCDPIELTSLAQVASPELKFKSCFTQEPEKYECEDIRYNYLKNMDKLLFLRSNIANKTFYLVDCLIFEDKSRVCIRKDKTNNRRALKELTDVGTVIKLNKSNILLQDEFICEENDNKEVNCDIDLFVPFEDGLKMKERIRIEGKIILKSHKNIMILDKNCIVSWCGYSGTSIPNRRNWFPKYDPPGGKTFRCYYANDQQVCVCVGQAALDFYSPQQDPDQFHIQTDEGDERYLLYQTHNGQYRKERRLKDGSVVGTTGWVGADGYLRLQDYIADNQGYRIHKSKTVYVGQNRPIGESLKIAKTAPTDSGYGVTPAPAVHVVRGQHKFSTTTPVPCIHSTLVSPHKFPSEVSVTPPSRSYARPTSTPQVVVSPNSIGSSTKFDFRPITATEAASTTASPYDYDSSNTNTIDDGHYGSDSTQYQRYDIYNPNSYRHSDEWLRRQQAGGGLRIGDGYTPQFPGYDGVAFRRNGFRYYLPKQYHEEESGNSNDKTGSFGYIDPFGIRRVIYYNSSPEGGFQIRKNNRYVGHDATPYDPRPIN